MSRHSVVQRPRIAFSMKIFLDTAQGGCTLPVVSRHGSILLQCCVTSLQVCLDLAAAAAQAVRTQLASTTGLAGPGH